ncbi:MAG: phenylalanine--tRNA ligase subunit alpha [bacterium]
MSSVELKKQVRKLKVAFNHDIRQVDDLSKFESVRIKYLGRKGEISNIFKKMGEVKAEDKRETGKLINEIKNYIQKTLAEYHSKLSQKTEKKEFFDYTLPGDQPFTGRYHPLTIVTRKIKDCFKKMGFSIAQGPEVESEYYNFEALNIPQGHPARDMQDTFFVKGGHVLRTHTSPVQIRVMEKQKPPLRIIAPGRCYRKDTPDSTHSPVFQQVEGLCVDEGITFADLKGVILNFAKSLLGSDAKIRFRPSFFPFTEPSAEYDFSCAMCKGRGCKICKQTGWIEISGAGMVNPRVLEFVNYDTEKYTGYAFGMGIERIAMLLYEIDDIRLFYENDVRFLNQF